MLALGAFSGDAVPVHLLTLEAFREYFRLLKCDGILAVHISNRYLDLRGVVVRAAAALRVPVAMITTTEAPEFGALASHWIVLANRPLEPVPGKPAVAPDPLAWTDDSVNLLKALR